MPPRKRHSKRKSGSNRKKGSKNNRPPVEEASRSTSTLGQYREAVHSQEKCAFNCLESRPLMEIHHFYRCTLLFEYKFYTEKEDKMCKDHQCTTNWMPLVEQIQTFIPKEDIDKCLFLSAEFVRELQEIEKKRRGIFNLSRPDYDWIKESDYKAWLGFTKEQFRRICSIVVGLDDGACMPHHIALLLCKLRCAISHSLIGSLFGLDTSTVATGVNMAQEAMLHSLVPQFLTHLNRETLASHMTPLAKELLDNEDEDKLAIIVDGLCRHIDKPDNLIERRRFYCRHKDSFMYKSMVGICPDGYVAFLLGPYDATVYDSKILDNCFARCGNSSISDQNEELTRQFGVLSTFQAGDTFLGDRWFNDSKHSIESRNLRLLAMNDHTKSLSDAQKETNGRLSKVNWIAGVTFGRLKVKFPYFGRPLPLRANDFKLLTIAMALLNMFFKPFTPGQGIKRKKSALSKKNKRERQVMELSDSDTEEASDVEDVSDEEDIVIEEDSDGPIELADQPYDDIDSDEEFWENECQQLSTVDDVFAGDEDPEGVKFTVLDC